jgi:propionyl-CoA carboxylase alpha chain
VPVLPDVALTDHDAVDPDALGTKIGFPLLVKASAGGGGRGMRIVTAPDDLADALRSARVEAAAAFGDGTLFVERLVANARHVEVQVLGDARGNVVHLFERDCSIQRRHQKIAEEAPAPGLDDALRGRLGDAAVALARAVGYTNAGTVEFLVEPDGAFWFLEMNTRLQVEHPVTELITGLDLVEQMIRVAFGEKLAFGQKDLKINGWAMESRIYAEDPYRGFLPSIGRLVRYSPPAEGQLGHGIVRNDAGVREGDEISMFYDPMISKLSTWGKTREAAIEAMGEALERFHIEGLGHNVPFLSAVMDQERFRSGKLSTNYIKDEFPEGFKGAAPTDFQRDAMAAAALYMHRVITRRAAPALMRDEWVVVENGERRIARATNGGDEFTVEFLGEGRTLKLSGVTWRPGLPVLTGVLDGRPSASRSSRSPKASASATARPRLTSWCSAPARPSCTRSCRPSRPPTPPRWCSRRCRAWWSASM